VFKTSINVCKVAQGVLSNFMVKAVMKYFYESIDFSLRCPLKKGLYQITNLKVDDQILPSVLSNMKFKLESRFLAKVKGQKSMVLAFAADAIGKLL